MASDKSPPPILVATRWNLAGRTALVTGATRGIGRGIVEELAGVGARVYVCARGEKEVDERVAEWRAQGLQVAGSACDVSSLEQCRLLMAAVSQHFDGKLDILVNNAGTAMAHPTADEAVTKILSPVIQTNFESGFNMSRLAYPLLKPSTNASLVFISSIASFTSVHPSCALYSASKAAINQLTKALACEWAKDGIRVNAVAPGYIHSDFLDKRMGLAPDYSAKVQARTPLGRFGDTHEIAATVAFLCMQGSTFTTGTVITIDGGYTAHSFATNS
ncbi:hypothetical protein GOP47_0001815 [Adiantum capillus-veneris]|uniref:Tropinone reductase n=1 Tax=Adiantum capillus-veneris TaxID=13818 RepID=A0A9D4ZQH4_ADICA|nr:hypothetical protein GOP47_0001815 [Adiantum capillus-veneris]